MQRLIIVFIFCLTSSGLSAQSSGTSSVSDAEVKKVEQDWSMWTSLRGVYHTSKNAQVFVDYQYVFPKSYYSLNEHYRSVLWLGADLALSSKWFVGVSSKVNFVEEDNGNIIPRVQLAHRGKLGKMYFDKELSYEHLVFVNTATYHREPEGRGALGGSLTYPIAIAGKDLLVGLSGKLYMNFDWKNDGLSIYDKRKFDRTRLSVNLDYPIIPQCYLGIYYLRDTEYYFTLGGFDSAGNKIPDYKLNNIYQGIGFRITYLFSKADALNIINQPIR
jgi:hypothetical protein